VCAIRGRGAPRGDWGLSTPDDLASTSDELLPLGLSIYARLNLSGLFY